MTNTPTKKKRGNPNWVKGGKSPNPKGAAAGRDVINKEVTNAIKYALDNNDQGSSEAYFVDLANNHKSLFVGLVQRIMPNETAVSVTVSLGDAMQEANARIAEYERNMLDITPKVVDIIDDDAKSLKTNDK